MDTAAIVIPIVVVAVLVVLLALYLFVTRQSLLALQQRVDEAWRDITEQVQHRAELLPRLTGAVQQAAPNDRAVYSAVEDARQQTLAASTPGEATAAENHLQQALKSVFTVAETYPQLSAGPQFLQLQGDLAESQEKIQASRRFYNGGVRELNNRIQVIPNRMFAKRLGVRPREFFEVSDRSAVAPPPRIQF